MRTLSRIIVVVSITLIKLSACGSKTSEEAGQVLLESLVHHGIVI